MISAKTKGKKSGVILKTEGTSPFSRKIQPYLSYLIKKEGKLK